MFDVCTWSSIYILTACLVNEVLGLSLKLIRVPSLHTEVHSTTPLVEREGENRLLQVVADYLEWYIEVWPTVFKCIDPVTLPLQVQYLYYTTLWKKASL